MFPLYLQSLIGIVIGGTVLLIKGCEYEGEHPKLRSGRVSGARAECGQADLWFFVPESRL